MMMYNKKDSSVIFLKYLYILVMQWLMSLNYSDGIDVDSGERVKNKKCL